LGVLAFTTLSDTRVRLVTLAILAMFALKTWVRRKDVMHPDEGNEQDSSEVEHGTVLPKADG
jgi:hypothetical protein